MAQDDPHPRDQLMSMGDPGPRFAAALRGYDRAEVDNHLAELESELRIAYADRDTAAARAAELSNRLSSTRSEVQALREQLHNVSAPTFDSVGARIADMLKLAEAEAEEIRRKARDDVAAQHAEDGRRRQLVEQRHSELERQATAALAEAQQRAADIERQAREQAAALTAGAEQHAARVRQQADEHAAATRQQTEAAAAALTADAEQRAAALQAETEARTAALQTEAEERAAALTADTEAKTQEELEDFELTMRSRRAKEAQADRERHEQSVAEAERRVAEATEQADQLVRAAEARVRELTDLRGRVLAQLHEIRRLTAALPAQAGVPAEAVPAETALTETAPTETAPTETELTDTAPTDTAPTETELTDTAPGGPAAADAAPTDPPPGHSAVAAPADEHTAAGAGRAGTGGWSAGLNSAPGAPGRPPLDGAIPETG